MGPREGNNSNTGDSTRGVPASALNDSTVEPVARRYAELRYQLLPYTYTLAWEARATGLPLMRALWLHYPDDTTARATGNEYLWGRDLLVAPVFTRGATSRDVYLPAGTWYDWWTGERTTGGRTVRRAVDLATMPLYARAGAIVPVDPVRQYTSEPVSGPTTLRVYPGADGAFTLYDDDGISQDYVKGVGSWIRLSWDDARRRLTLAPGAPAGSTNVVTPRTFEVVLVPGDVRKTVRFVGAPLTVTF
jgi:alpha-glucosidase/alpha-D-xyloside xylohydrolase